jgi:hypothetical protein
MTFALDDPDELWGFDEAAWMPDRILVRRFITWCENALAAFYAFRRSINPAAMGKPAKSTEGATINSPAPSQAEAEGATKPSAAIAHDSSSRDPRQPEYDAWVASKGTIPTTDEDKDWAARHSITQARVARMRAANPNPALHQRGPRNSRNCRESR